MTQKSMSFIYVVMVTVEEFLKKKQKKNNNKIWSTRKNFNSKPVFNDKYLETKMKSYQDKITPDFNGKVYLSVFQIMQKLFSYTFLEECKYKIKKKEIKFFILMS